MPNKAMNLMNEFILLNMIYVSIVYATFSDKLNGQMKINITESNASNILNVSSSYLHIQ